jgi:cardiolipin synthase A/B
MKSRIWTIVWTAIVTALVVLVSMNFTRPEKRVEHRIEHLFGIDDPQFKREMANLLGPCIVGGNRIAALQNGDQIFPAMLDAIRAAQHTITFETYIYWSGTIGRQFAEALAQRARAGVKVHVMLDWVGSAKMEPELVDTLVDAGVEVERFHPLHWYTISKMNNRTHRKLLVVDGRVGFVGGVGIADQWSGNAQDPDHWRDSHFRVEGPVVAQMQAAFLDNWIKTTGRVLHGSAYFPPLERAGGQDMHLFTSSPAGGSSSMRLMYLSAITATQRTIDIQAAYFVPDELMRSELIRARERGVRVRVLLPDKHLDSDTVRLASKGGWGPLLQRGIEIYEYEPTMMHSKMLIFDGEVVSVGSTNFDMRSFERNDEASLNVYDVEFARAMSDVFERDLQQATRYTYERWAARPWRQKLAETVLIPIRSQL